MLRQSLSSEQAMGQAIWCSEWRMLGTCRFRSFSASGCRLSAASLSPVLYLELLWSDNQAYSYHLSHILRNTAVSLEVALCQSQIAFDLSHIQILITFHFAAAVIHRRHCSTMGKTVTIKVGRWPTRLLSLGRITSQLSWWQLTGGIDLSKQVWQCHLRIMGCCTGSFV